MAKIKNNKYTNLYVILHNAKIDSRGGLNLKIYYTEAGMGGRLRP
jgi:hypothetical protein